MASFRRIRIPNPKLSTSELTQLDADYSTGTSLTVLSNLGFAAQDIAVIGQTGDDNTEQKDVTGTTTNIGITISAALKFAHQKQTTIYRSSWNQVSIERQYTSSGTWAVLITTDIQWDKQDTLYIDSSSSDQYNYRFRFYNSISVTYSDYSPTMSGGGTTPNQVGRMVINVRNKVRDFNRERISDERIIQLLSEGQNVISGIRHDWWFLKVDTYELSKRSLGSGISTVGNQSYYDLATYTDFNYLHRIRYKYNVNTTNQIYDLTPKPDEDFDRFEQTPQITNNNNILHFKVAPPDSGSTVGYFVVFPIPADTSGTFYPIYYKNMNTLNDISDTTNVPYPEILEDYAAWRIHNDLKNELEANMYKNLFFGPYATPIRGGVNPTQATGIALLTLNQNSKTKTSNQPKALWKFKGRRGNINSFGQGVYNHDVIKENWF